MNGHEKAGWSGTRKRLSTWAAAALAVVVALLFDTVNWDGGTVIVLIVLLVTPALIHELAARYSGRNAFRLALGLAIAAAMLLMWINGAVGIIGDDDNPANRIYHGVVAVGLIGALVARLKPRSMAVALVCTAAAQAVALIVALVAGWGFTGPITLLFVGMWLASARLFRTAADQLPHPGSVPAS